MKNIWCFGGSMSQSYDSNAKWFKKYAEWKGFIIKSYPELLNDFFKSELFNYSEDSNNNSSIFQCLCDNINKIEKNSLVIIHWTPFVRFRMIDNNMWKNFTPNNIDFDDLQDISKNTINEILINRLDLEYEKEIYSWESIIKKALKDCFLIFVYPDYYGNIKTFTKIDFNGIINHLEIERISQETNKLIRDNHYSENGHRQMFISILSLLNEYNKTII